VLGPIDARLVDVQLVRAGGTSVAVSPDLRRARRVGGSYLGPVSGPAQYKSGEPRIAERQAARLGELLAAHWDRHSGCIVGLDVPDVSVVVPSGPRGRPPPHPLGRLVARCSGLPPMAPLMVPGVGSIEHRQPQRDGYRVVGDVRGARILLVDDLYTSGAHLQSAACSLRMAGAASVRGFTVGRLVCQAAAAVGCPKCRAAMTAKGRSDPDGGQGEEGNPGSWTIPAQASPLRKNRCWLPGGWGWGRGASTFTDRLQKPPPKEHRETYGPRPSSGSGSAETTG